jgi:hypothetical protein
MLQGVPRTLWQLEDRPLAHGETRLIAELADVAVDFGALWRCWLVPDDQDPRTRSKARTRTRSGPGSRQIRTRTGPAWLEEPEDQDQTAWL